ncbi:acyltransferase [Candidatus Altiarchaeota archaeon]
MKSKLSEEKEFYVHPTAEVSEKSRIGKGTKIWHQAQVRENVEIGENSIVGKSVYIDFNVKIGSGVKIQNNVNVYHGVTIEDDVFVGPNATFTNDMFPRAFLWDDSRLVKTRVKKGASIGANATVVCGITLGEYSMVGAGSVATSDVPDHGLVYGSPAKLHGFVCECGFKLEVTHMMGGMVGMRCLKCNKEIEIPKEVYSHMEEE